MATALTTVSGLASGIQTDDMIQKILDIAKQPITAMQNQQADLRARQAAYQDANTRLSAVRDAAGTLSQAGFFSTRIATSADTSAVLATAGAGATPGDYQISVEQVARAHQILSQSYGDLDTTRLGTGSFSVTSGGRTTTITVDNSDNTLAGLKDAINRANSNIRASIVQDGDNSYRLLIASKDTGTANSLTIDASLTGGTGPSFADLQAAQDAKVKMGSGANAITLTRSTNTVTDLIPGVTLNLLKQQPGTQVQVSVTQDTQTITDAVQKLVDQFNNAVDFMNTQFKFDSDTGKGGVLLGDETLRGLQDSLMSAFTGGVPGMTGTLADLGVTVGGDGKMAFDASTFQQKLTDDPVQVTNLFSLTYQSTNAAVSLASVGSKAIVDGSAYAVNITQAATQARVTSGTAQAGVLDANETLTVNGIAIDLTAGMTQAEVLTAINARSKDTNLKAYATGADGTGTGNFLTFLSTGYGSKVGVNVVSSLSSASGVTSGVGNVTATQTNAAGEGGAGTGSAGLNVAGSINGEAATGDGQILVGNAGNQKTDGLKIRITSTITGDLGSIRVFPGVAFSAKRTLDLATDLAVGPLWTEQTSLDQQIKDLDSNIVDKQAAIDRQEQALRTKFAAMENALSGYQSQSAYLTSQLASLNK